MSGISEIDDDEPASDTDASEPEQPPSRAVQNWRRFVVVAVAVASPIVVVVVVCSRSRLWKRAKQVRKYITLAGNLMNLCKEFNQDVDDDHDDDDDDDHDDDDDQDFKEKLKVALPVVQSQS